MTAEACSVVDLITNEDRAKVGYSSPEQSAQCTVPSFHGDDVVTTVVDYEFC